MKRSRRNHSPAFKALPGRGAGNCPRRHHPARDHIKQALMPYREMGMQYWVEKAESAVRAL